MDDNITAISFVALGTSVPDRIVVFVFFFCLRLENGKEAIQNGLVFV